MGGGYEGWTYRVDLQIPWLAWGVQVNGDLFEGETKLLENNVGAMSPGAGAIGVENNLGGRHDEYVYRSKELTAVKW